MKPVILGFCVTAARGLAINLHFEPFCFYKMEKFMGPLKASSCKMDAWKMIVSFWDGYLAGGSC